jgi:hypothetical protein
MASGPLSFVHDAASLLLIWEGCTMKHSVGLVVLAAALALGGCGGGEDQAAGGVTKEESQQLNEAAEMLDASPDSLVISNEAELGNGDAGVDAAEMPVEENGTDQAQ